MRVAHSIRQRTPNGVGIPPFADADRLCHRLGMERSCLCCGFRSGDPPDLLGVTTTTTAIDAFRPNARIRPARPLERHSARRSLLGLLHAKRSRPRSGFRMGRVVAGRLPMGRYRRSARQRSHTAVGTRAARSRPTVCGIARSSTCSIPDFETGTWARGNSAAPWLTIHEGRGGAWPQTRS